MQIVYHLGAHFTDEDRLLKCLLKNKGILAKEGIAVPGPGRYRQMLRQASFALKGQPASPELQEEILDSVLDVDHADRVIFSAPSLICPPVAMLRNGVFYERAGERVSALQQMFPENGIEIHLGLRNPATLLPTVAAGIEHRQEFLDLLAMVDPRAIRWSDVVARIRGENPDVPLTIWCNEDTPLIWPQVLREVSGHDTFTVLRGTNDLLSTIMTDEGMERMNTYLKSHPPATEVHRRRIVAAFLDKFAIPDAVEMELDLPGWDDELVDQITEMYEEDVYQIEKMQGVNMIAP